MQCLHCLLLHLLIQCLHWYLAEWQNTLPPQNGFLKTSLEPILHYKFSCIYIVNFHCRHPCPFDIGSQLEPRMDAGVFPAQPTKYHVCEAVWVLQPSPLMVLTSTNHQTVPQGHMWLVASDCVNIHHFCTENHVQLYQRILFFSTNHIIAPCIYLIMWCQFKTYCSFYFNFS